MANARTSEAPEPTPKGRRARTQKPKVQRPIENLSGLLDRVCSLVECTTVPLERTEKVTVRALLDTIGRRAYGPLLLAVGIFGISPITAVPGLTWLTAALTLLIALQLMFGLQSPWLPRRVQEASFSSAALVKAVEAMRPWAARIDKVLKPRFEFLTHPPFVLAIGALVSAAALVTFPLGFIPFAPLLPGAAVVLFGLGLVARDGLLLTFGAALVTSALAVAYRIIV